MKTNQVVTKRLLGFMLLAAIAPVYAVGNGQPKIYGKTYGEWSAKWWQWAYAGPDGKNVIQDTTGKFCAKNQPQGKVWFLAGTFGGSVKRKCTIPPNRALFYPLDTILWTDCPGTSDANLKEKEIRDQLAKDYADNSCQLTSTLDGVSISSLRILTVRTQSPKFTTILPKNNLVSGCPAPLPAGRTGREISDGYWIMLPPLTPGKHKLTLHWASCDSGTGNVVFESGVTYHLTVRR
jgi:hypothetical protein